MARRATTEPTPPRQLSAEQQQVLAALLEGKAESDAAQAAGVDTTLVRTWATDDALFVAERNRARKAQWSQWQERLRNLVPLAADSLEDILKSEDDRTRLSCAVAILRAVGLFGQDLAPTGPTTEAQVRNKLLTDLLY